MPSASGSGRTTRAATPSGRRCPGPNAPGGGFTAAGVRPWLPMADPAQCNVADQEDDPDSVLAFTRRAIARRAASDDLAVGTYRSLPSPTDTWVFGRGTGTVVALNMSDAATEIDGLGGSITLATDRAVEGTAVDGTLTLAPWSGVPCIGAMTAAAVPLCAARRPRGTPRRCWPSPGGWSTTGTRWCSSPRSTTATG